MKSLILILSILLNIQHVSITYGQESLHLSPTPTVLNKTTSLATSNIQPTTSRQSITQVSSTLVMPSPFPTPNKSVNATTQPGNGTEKSTIDLETLRILLEILSMEGYFRIVDMCFAISCLGVLTVLKLPKSTKFFVHKNLILSIGIIDFLVGIFSQKDVNAELRKKQPACTTIFIANYYWSLVLFSWMVIEAYNICMKLSKVFDTSSKFKTHMGYLIFGYCIPAIITIIVALVFYDEILKTGNCFSFSQKDIWIFRGPIFAYLSVIALAFLYIFGLTCKHIISSKKYEGGFRKFIASIRTFLVLYPILGIGQIFLLFWEVAPIVLAWVVVLCSSFLAALFFILHILLDAQVQEAALKMLGKRNNAIPVNAGNAYNMNTSQTSVAATGTVCSTGHNDNTGRKEKISGRLNTKL